MKFALVAAVAGSAAAHGHCPFRKFWHRAENNCPDRDNSQLMDNHDFIRAAKRTMWENVIKGTYHDQRGDILDDMCMGDWMKPKAQNIHKTFHNLFHGGLWTVSHQEIKDASSDILDLVLDNIEHCDVYRFFYGQYTWCMDNIETCAYHKGFADRVINNGFELVGNAFRIKNEWNTNGDCFTDEQMLDKIGIMTEGVASSITTLRGFEGTWDRSTKMEHLTFHQMHHNVKDLKHQTPRPHEACPIKTIFQHFFGEEIVEVEKEIMHNLAAMMPFHHKPVHHQTHHTIPQMPMMSWGFPLAFQNKTPAFAMPRFEMPHFQNMHLF